VTVAIEAAFADRKKFDSALLPGPSGTGKTTMAGIIAKEMAVQLHELPGYSIQGMADLNAVLLAAADRDVVHIDECQLLKKQFQTALYLALDRRGLVAGGSGGTPQELPIADFTLLLSTTDEYGLLEPLRNRAKLVLRFDFYSAEELAEIVAIRSRLLGWEIDPAILPMIAKRAKGTPRLAIRLLQSGRRVCRAAGATAIALEHFEQACRLESIDGLGLGPIESRYLRLVHGGVSRLGVLASMLGQPPRTIAVVVEPFLLRAGLIAKDDHGRRALTKKGAAHLGATP
jgi:Holliday junction DNA helicase RuvB